MLAQQGKKYTTKHSCLTCFIVNVMIILTLSLKKCKHTVYIYIKHTTYIHKHTYISWVNILIKTSRSFSTLFFFIFYYRELVFFHSIEIDIFSEILFLFMNWKVVFKYVILTFLQISFHLSYSDLDWDWH